MTTLTIFCHGTGFNRVKGTQSNELVALLHNIAGGGEARIHQDDIVLGRYIINEGPGSTTGNTPLPSEVNPMTGRLKSQETVHYGGQGNRSNFARAFAGQRGGGHGATRGNFDGHGWNENVQRTLQIMQMLQFTGQRNITRVNMVGWSRGAVTCMRIANGIYDVFGDTIRMNIFAVDPVAGQNAGLTMDDTRIIPETVDYYVAVLAMNERRQTFKPQDMSRMQVQSPQHTRVVYLPMPGKHNEQVMGRSGVAGESSARVSLSLAYAFLRNFGTNFTGVPAGTIGSDRSMAKAYARLRLHLDDFQDTGGFGNRVIGTGLQRRDFAKKANFGQYVSGGKGGYWVNEHHRSCFRAAFPQFYGQVFRRSHQDGQLSPLLPFMGQLGNADSWMVRSLESMGYVQTHLGARQLVHGSGYTHHAHGNFWPGALPRHA